MPAHVKRGDLVMVITGSDRHRKNNVGKVLRVIRSGRPNEDQVIVEGMNVRKRHIRPSQEHPQGDIIQKEMPIHISNVMPVQEGHPTRVRFETRPDGSKVRLAARDGKVLGPELRRAKQ